MSDAQSCPRILHCLHCRGSEDDLCQAQPCPSRSLLTCSQSLPDVEVTRKDLIPKSKCDTKVLLKMIVFFPAHDWKKKFSLRLAPRSSLSPVSLPGLHSLLCRSVALSLIHTPLGFSLTPSLSLSLSPSIPNVFPPVCVCLLLQYFLHKALRVGGGG
jgi:hypothetical protein